LTRPAPDIAKSCRNTAREWSGWWRSGTKTIPSPEFSEHMEDRLREAAGALERQHEALEATRECYYGPSKGHIASRNWKRLGDALAALGGDGQ
jgi:hypothetical protein